MNTPKAIHMRETKLSKSDDKWMQTYFDMSYTKVKDDEKFCRVGASATHGNGVFATRDFKKGDVITVYPAHFVVWNTEDGELIATPKQNPQEENTYYRLVALDGKCSVSGNPSIHHSIAAGHLLNDGGVVGTFTKETMQADICRYMLTTIKNENCDFVQQTKDKMMFVVAQKDIKKGEELFVSYGLQYWLSSIGDVPGVCDQKDMWKFVLSVCGKAKTEYLLKIYRESCGDFQPMGAKFQDK